MNADELIRTWPGIAKANAETLLASPAWRLTVLYGETKGEIRKTEEPIADGLAVDITVDGEPNRLVLADTDIFPDLHLLWKKRRDLPSAVLLALVEKDCGAFLQMLENVLRMQIAVKGLASTDGSDGRTFEFRADRRAAVFALVTTGAVTMAWGRIANLDTGHAAIRDMTREAWTELASLDLLENETDVLASGAALIVPEDARPAWRVSSPSDDLVHVRAIETASVSFGRMADDDWPETPDTEGLAVELTKEGRVIGTGHMGKFGLQRAVRLD